MIIIIISGVPHDSCIRFRNPLSNSKTAHHWSINFCLYLNNMWKDLSIRVCFHLIKIFMFDLSFQVIMFMPRFAWGLFWHLLRSKVCSLSWHGSNLEGEVDLASSHLWFFFCVTENPQAPSPPSLQLLPHFQPPVSFRVLLRHVAFIWSVFAFPT